MSANTIDIQILPSTIADKDLGELKYAKSLLEKPGLAIQLTNTIGAPIETLIDKLPSGSKKYLDKGVDKAMNQALNFALGTMNKTPGTLASNKLHKMAAIASGTLGAGGLATFPLEISLSTTMILRSIVDIANSHHFDLDNIERRTECLEVFAMGGRAKNDDGANSSYFAIRALLAKEVSEAAKYLAQKGIAEASTPALVKIMSTLTSRFGLVLTEKMAAMAVPLVGAAGGSIVNYVFMDHFQKMAEGHFIVKKLEARYGKPFVEEQYNQLPLKQK